VLRDAPRILAAPDLTRHPRHAHTPRGLTKKRRSPHRLTHRHLRKIVFGRRLLLHSDIRIELSRIVVRCGAASSDAALRRKTPKTSGVRSASDSNRIFVTSSPAPGNPPVRRPNPLPKHNPAVPNCAVTTAMGQSNGSTENGGHCALPLRPHSPAGGDQPESEDRIATLAGLLSDL